jgi:Kef-type K+ transport system membrane component KefB
MNIDVIAHVLLALAAVVVGGRLLGRAMSAMGQPRVVGEVLTGILLGPSLLGRLAPGGEAFLFPATVKPALGVVARVGVLLYLFLVGLEFDPGLLRRGAGRLVAASQGSIALPFVLGCALGFLLHVPYVPAGVPESAFVLFMGLAMSITAFPVLARILTDRGLTRTELGSAALACAAVNDVLAWCLLAVVVGFTRAMPTTGVPGELVIAFALGAMLPGTGGTARVARTWGIGVVTVLLLPAFFALTGLRTQIALVSSARDWIACLLIVTAATVGKVGGAALAGRLAGMPWRFAAQLGALMNTRGLMELIVLGVGLDAGIITPTVYTMMVIMAIVTTAMTGPMLDALEQKRPQARTPEAS